MNDKEFRAEMKSGLRGGYLLYGDEDYLKDHLVRLAEKSVAGDDDFSSVNIFESSEDSYDASTISQALSMAPMMAEKCISVCRVRLSDLRESEKENLVTALDAVNDDMPVVLLVVIPASYLDEGNLRRGKPSSDYKELTERLKPVSVPYQMTSTLKKWVAKHYEADGLYSSDDALSYIVDLCGPGMTSLSKEIEKVICYTLSQGKSEVTRSEIDLVCCEHGEPDAFALSNAVVSGDREGALSALRECRDRKQKPTAVIARMTSDFINMYSVASLSGDGMVKQDIAKRLAIHEFRVGKYLDAVRDVDPAAIRAVISRCVEVETALKSSGGGFDVLEKFVCTIPSKRRSMKRYG